MPQLRNGLELNNHLDPFDLNKSTKKYFIDNYHGFDDEKQQIGLISLDDSIEADNLRRWCKIFHLQIKVGFLTKNVEMCYPRNLEVNIANVNGIYPIDIYKDNMFFDEKLQFGYRRMCKIESEKFLGRYHTDEKLMNTKTPLGLVRYVLERDLARDKNMFNMFKKLTERIKK